MKEKISDKLPPLRQEYKLTDDNKLIVKRFVEELEHRLGVQVGIEAFKENFLAYPSIGGDTVCLEVRVGNWRSVQMISEMELDTRVSGSFYYFCRRLVDKTMGELLKIGAQRA